MKPFKIYEDIPMPVTKRGKYPFEDLKVGAMFFVPLDEGLEENQENLDSHRKKLSGAATMAGKRLSCKFSTAIVNDTDEETGKTVWGTGVWRIA